MAIETHSFTWGTVNSQEPNITSIDHTNLFAGAIGIGGTTRSENGKGSASFRRRTLNMTAGFRHSVTRSSHGTLVTHAARARTEGELSLATFSRLIAIRCLSCRAAPSLSQTCRNLFRPHAIRLARLRRTNLQEKSGMFWWRRRVPPPGPDKVLATSDLRPSGQGFPRLGTVSSGSR
jgi:hypothetical protein